MSMKQPGYREAYPRLDIREIQSAVLHKRTACLYTSETGVDLGQAFILDLKEATIVLGFALHGPYFAFRKGEILLGLEHAPDPVNPYLHFFHCRGCGNRRKVLFFKWDWMCGACHKLSHRSRLLRGEVRDYEYVASRCKELRDLLAKGRPHRMRHTMYDALQLELDQREEWLQVNPRRVASADHQYLITGTWMQPRDLPNGLAHSGYYVLGNAIEKTPEHLRY